MGNLVIRLDDLGFSEAVNYGICKVVKEKRASCVGMMSNMEAATHGYELIKNEKISLGLHINICVGKPVSPIDQISSLVEGDFFYSSKDIRNRSEDSVILEEAILEVEAQLRRFKEITGKNPDYIEAHAVASQTLNQAIELVAYKYHIFFDNVMIDKEWEKQHQIYGLMGQMNQEGIYDAQSMLLEHLEDLQKQTTVVVFHPGYIDYYLLQHSSYTTIRAFECDFLCGHWFRDFIINNALNIVDFKGNKY